MAVERSAVEWFTAGQARRLALAAQGFAAPRPTGRIDVRHLRRVLDQIAILQLDSVNVFCRSHYLPLFSRLGPYPRDLLDRMSRHGPPLASREPEMFEYWAHAASLVPVGLQPSLRWRMARADVEPWPAVRAVARDNPNLVAQLHELVRRQGPITGGGTGIARPAARRGELWNWHAGKTALEYLFYAGVLSTAKRVNFERYYDLSERVLPKRILELSTPDEACAKRELVRVSARALGIASEPELRDYFRISQQSCRVAIAELVEIGELVPAAVEGWPMPAYRWHEARVPRRTIARALLSPFDSLIWFRQRTERLFGFRYRLEIYTPAARRKHGYYVLPFLLGDELVARVDLKSDRRAGVLRVCAAWVEPGHRPRCVARELAQELWLAARWLELSAVWAAPHGNLACDLIGELDRAG